MKIDIKSKITVEMDGNSFELTRNEAEELYLKLCAVLGKADLDEKHLPHKESEKWPELQPFLDHNSTNRPYWVDGHVMSHKL